MVKMLIGGFLLFIAFLASKTNPQHSIKKPMTLVRLKDTIYHCEQVVSTPCGYYLACGRQSFHCASNIITEQLH